MRNCLRNAVVLDIVLITWHFVQANDSSVLIYDNFYSFT